MDSGKGIVGGSVMAAFGQWTALVAIGSFVTFLIVNRDTQRRSLRTLQRDKVGAIEIVGADMTIQVLYGPDGNLRQLGKLEKP